MAAYDLPTVLDRLRDAAQFAQAEGDFKPLKKWLDELEESITAGQEELHDLRSRNEQYMQY